MSKNSEKIKVSLMKQDTEAVINVPLMTSEGPLDPPPTIEDARKALKRAGVVHGIRENCLKRIFDEALFDQDVRVAVGSPAKDGKNAYIEYFFETIKKYKPKEDRNGRIDYKEVSLLTNVSKGDRLCRLHPATEGESGLTVTGKVVKPRPGKKIRMPNGPNTEIAPDDPGLLIASVSGCVTLNRSRLVVVQPRLEIKKDVDYSTGNIDFVGSLVIGGDIKAGFRVKVSGDLEVNGCVEDAEVEAGGNVLIKNGFIGYGKGVIRSKGDVTVKYVNGQQIYCEGNLIVGGEILHCNAKVGGDVLVESNKGSIIGGVIKAKGSIKATQIGNINYTRTEVAVGCCFKLLDRVAEIEKELAQVNANQEKVKKGIYNLTRLRMKCGGKLPEEQEKLLERLKATDQHYPLQAEKLKEEKERLEQQISEHQDSHVTVLRTIFPGVRIAIGRFVRTFNEQMDRKVFQEIKGEIIAAA